MHFKILKLNGYGHGKQVLVSTEYYSQTRAYACLLGKYLCVELAKRSYSLQWPCVWPNSGLSTCNTKFIISKLLIYLVRTGSETCLLLSNLSY